MNINDFNYELPENRIAQTPIYPRDHSKLMVLKRDTEEIEHDYFYNLDNYLAKGDLLVINSTRVIPARLIGKKETGGVVEIFLLNRLEIYRWECLVKPGKKLKLGQRVTFGNNQELVGVLEEIKQDGNRIILFEYSGTFEHIIDILGEMPLPPYIKKKLTTENRDRYQTIYAKKGESVAAPTAGLHFTDELIYKIKEKGIDIAEIFLKVGLGTFRPVSADNIKEHKMHTEEYEIPQEASDKINAAKKRNARVIAIGTTSVRTLETVGKEGKVACQSGETDIFIYPGYDFEIVDSLVTNFHLPKSTLLMLVSAFSNRDFILRAYNGAIENGYRFFSFGDAMLII